LFLIASAFFFFSFFANPVNYLSHFLLTEKLLEQTDLLKQSNYPRIVHVTSSFHFAADGSDLRTFHDSDKATESPPIASLPGGSHGFVVSRSQRQYANSKLAQIVHARYYQRKYPGIASLTACPAWVGTQIIAQEDSLVAKMFRAMAFPAHGYGLSSILRAMFVDYHQQKNDGSIPNDFYTNNKLVRAAPYLDDALAATPLVQKLTYQWLPIRDAFVFCTAMILLHWQRVLPSVEPAQSSKATFDVQLQEDLYQWSRQAVQPWL
jgi:NAD(P)-dependent dehydrogenase (short-subunit alcohol dehydrogenase family)